MLVVAFLPFGVTAEENTCIIAAFNDYNRANLAFLSSRSRCL